MKASFFYAFLALVPSISATPMPQSDPLNLDLCGLTGSDVDLTPVASHPKKFKLQAVRSDGSTLRPYVHSHALAKGFGYQTNANGQATAGGLVLTLKDHIVSGTGEAHDHQKVRLGYLFVSGALSLFPFLSAQSKYTLIKFEIRHICDPVSKKAIQVLEPLPGLKDLPSKLIRLLLLLIFA